MNKNDTLFITPKSSNSDRIIYTPSTFARTSLIHLQETGTLQAILPHASRRSGLSSFLFFIVLDGNGKLKYKEIEYDLSAGDCVFIDCKKDYSHSTGYGDRPVDKDSDVNAGNLWKLSWCHFFGPNMGAIYDKYMERGGKPVFKPVRSEAYTAILKDLYDIASSTSYVRDMKIQEKLCELLALLMEDSWNPERGKTPTGKAVNIQQIKDYIDLHYTEKIVLDGLASDFYINKYYMSRLFKEQYGFSINDYVIHLRITKGKRLLRFGTNEDGNSMTIEQICTECGISDPNYFTRLFKKVEGISPSEYKKLW